MLLTYDRDKALKIHAEATQTASTFLEGQVIYYNILFIYYLIFNFFFFFQRLLKVFLIQIPQILLELVQEMHLLFTYFILLFMC
jgi:hypothetical protein